MPKELTSRRAGVRWCSYPCLYTRLIKYHVHNVRLFIRTPNYLSNCKVFAPTLQSSLHILHQDQVSGERPVCSYADTDYTPYLHTTHTIHTHTHTYTHYTHIYRRTHTIYTHTIHTHTHTPFTHTHTHTHSKYLFVLLSLILF